MTPSDVDAQPPASAPKRYDGWPTPAEQFTSMRVQELRNELYRLSRRRDLAQSKVDRCTDLIHQLEDLQDARHQIKLRDRLEAER